MASGRESPRKIDSKSGRGRVILFISSKRARQNANEKNGERLERNQSERVHSTDLSRFFSRL